jgi:hypothetical protein
MQFTAMAGFTYTVESASDLAGGNWSKLLDVPADPTPRQITITTPSITNAARQFYRVVTPLQP